MIRSVLICCLALAEGACGITCPAYAQKIDGYCYAVMDKTSKATQPNFTCPSSPNCAQDCQIDFIPMPAGWQIAPCPGGWQSEVARAMYSGGPAPNSTTGQPATYICMGLWLSCLQGFSQRAALRFSNMGSQCCWNCWL